MKPSFTKTITQSVIDQAAAAGLPIINGKQAVAAARKQIDGQDPVNWYKLENGNEITIDDNGMTVSEWPEDVSISELEEEG